MTNIKKLRKEEYTYIYKPISPTRRHIVKVKELTKLFRKKNKTLHFGLIKTGGRNNTGKICVRHRGGGSKQNCCIINFKINPDTLLIFGIKQSVSRFTYIACGMTWTNCKYTYILLANNVNFFNFLNEKTKPWLFPGNTFSLTEIPIGSIIHNVELRPKKGSQLARAAGTKCILISKDFNKNLVFLKLPSKKTCFVNIKNFAVFGNASNENIKLQKWGNAGKSRHRGIRPHVRGVAMNPIDHPHGGGQGKTSGGRPSVTPWGIPTKGKPTVKKTKKYF